MLFEQPPVNGEIHGQPGPPDHARCHDHVREITLDWKGKFTLDGEIFEAKGPLIIEPADPARFLKI